MNYYLLAASLLLAAPAAHAQTAPPATTPSGTQAKAIRAKTADRRAEAYQGPQVVSNNETLRQQMMQKSKPADALRMQAKDIPGGPKK